MKLSSAALSVVCLSLAACTLHHHPVSEPYAPGLGEIMAQTAARHAKLWFAGQAGNWPLAEYELDELREGFEDAGKFHPTHKHIATPLPKLVAGNMDAPLDALEKSVKGQDKTAFIQAYDSLTHACNACHQMTEFGFNRVIRPTLNPFANQEFFPANGRKSD